MVETCGSDGYTLSRNPINCIKKLELATTSRYSGGDLGPSGLSDFSVHVEATVHATQDLVSEVGQLFIIVSTVQGDSKFVLVGVIRQSSSKLSAD